MVMLSQIIAIKRKSSRQNAISKQHTLNYLAHVKISSHLNKVPQHKTDIIKSNLNKRPIGGQSKLSAIKRPYPTRPYTLRVWDLSLHHSTSLVPISCFFHRGLLFVVLDRKNSPPDFALFWAGATEKTHS